MRKMLVNDEMISFELNRDNDSLEIVIGENSYQFFRPFMEQNTLSFDDNKGRRHQIIRDDSGSQFLVNAKLVEVISAQAQSRKRSSKKEGEMLSPMPGKVLKLMVSEGDSVEQGQALMILEAMKMEHTIRANKAGKVEKIFFGDQDLVEGGVELIKINSES